MDFNHYFTNDEVEALLGDWQQAYPHLASVQTVGQSYSGKSIKLLTLTSASTGPDTDKPAVWIDANIHATEIAGTTTALNIAWALLDGYGKNEQATRLLDQSVYYIVPRVNPDGAGLALGDIPRFIRSGIRLYPFADRQEGLHRQDIDGDGRIVQMRIPDPNGDWKASSLDPRLLEKRQPEEHGGVYYRLLPEGLLEDYDGYLVKVARPPEGLDFNRNFPFEWRPEGDQRGAGPYPASEPEIKALIDFIVAHPNINIALSYHTFSRVILRPYSTRPDEDMETNDLWVFKKIGEIGTRITGYRCVSTFHDFKYHPKEVTTGAFDDWLFDQLGTFTYTIEQWDLPTEAGIKDRKFMDWFRDHPHEEDLQILKWVDEHAPGSAYVDWHPFDHPQLGKVELGGWNELYSWRNPPVQWMGAEAARNVPFALAAGDLLPHLSIHSLSLTRLGTNEFRLQLVVENTGFLPTFTSQQAKKRKAIRPVRVELDLPENARLLNGKRRTELDHLEGRSNKLDVDTLWSTSPMDNRARGEWVIQAAPGQTIELKVMSERAGTLHQSIVLE